MKSSTAVSALDVIRTLHIIGHQTDEIFDALLRKEFGLTLARMRILMPLTETGAMTQADIARFHFLTEASIARQVQLLITEGYLKRTPDKSDGRKFILTFTKKTEIMLPQIKARLGAEIAAVYSNLTAADFTALDTLLSKLRAAGVQYTGIDQFCS